MSKLDINSLLQFCDPRGTQIFEYNDWQYYISSQVDISWLITEMEIKAQEHSMRTGKPIAKETTDRIEVLKRHLRWLARLLPQIDELQSRHDELERKIEYYKAQQPRVDFSKLRMHYNGQRVKYIKDFVKPIDNDNY